MMENPTERIEFGEYIVADPRICHGKLTYKGTRLFVSDALEMLAEDTDWDEIIRQFHGSICREAIAETVRLAGEALLDKVPKEQAIAKERAVANERAA